MRSALVVDDNDLLAEQAEAWFTQEGYETRVAHDAPSALTEIQNGFVPDILFTDIVMPGAFDGFELAKRVRRDYPEVCILLTTGWAVPDYSPFEVLIKPYRLADLCLWIAQHQENNARYPAG